MVDTSTTSTPVVTLIVSCSITGVMSERRISRDDSIAILKSRLEPITGIRAAVMQLRVLNGTGNVCILADDSRLVSSYPIHDNMKLEVTPCPGSIDALLADTDDVDLDSARFRLTDADYDARTDSVRSFLRRNGLGRFAQGVTSTKPQSSTDNKDDKENEVKDFNGAVIHVGARCETRLPGRELRRRGIVRFIGHTAFKPGQPWIGVEYDEPCGAHDGAVDGRRYFSANSRHGAFLRPIAIATGDFPEEDISLESDEDEL